MANKVASSVKPEKIIDPEPKNRFEDDDTENKVSRDFFWDQIIKFASSGMLLIAALDIVTSLNSDPVKCHGPDRFTRDQSAFMNGYCSEKTPKVDYFLFFIVGQAIVLVGPHFVWSSWFSGKLTHFISEALSLERHRESSSGDYAARNYVTVKSLKNTFGSSKTIHRAYFVKELLQFMSAIGAAVCAGAAFYECDRRDIFDPVYSCQFTGPETDYMNVEDYVFNVTCVVPALRSHRAVWITNFVLLAGVLLSTFTAMFWWIAPHESVLNWNQAALFSLESGIEPHHYRTGHRMCFRIKTDLDFLVLRLFGQDEGHGTVLREVLVILTIRDLLHETKEDLTLSKSSGMAEEQASDYTSSSLIPPVPPREKLKKTYEQQDLAKFGINGLASFLLHIIRTIDQRFSFKENEEITAVDLAFGTEGFHHVLAQVSKWVVSLNLDHHYLNIDKPVVAQSFTSGIRSIRTRSDIYAQPFHINNKFSEVFIRELRKDEPKPPPGAPNFIRGRAKTRINLFVVSPFSDPDRVVTVHWFLYRMRIFIHNDAKLIVIRPTKIGGRNVENTFQKFEPMWPWGREEERESGYNKKYYQEWMESFTCEEITCEFNVTIYKVCNSALPPD